MIQPHLPVRLPCSRWPLRRRRAWTLSSSSYRRGVRRVVSEGSRVSSDFPADCPHRSVCHFHPFVTGLRRLTRDESTVGSTGYPSKQPNFCRSLLPARGRKKGFYDFVPVAGPTFDGCLLAVGPPASGVTDSHDVTGGVYKAREHIHRSVLTCGY